MRTGADAKHIANALFDFRNGLLSISASHCTLTGSSSIPQPLAHFLQMRRPSGIFANPVPNPSWRMTTLRAHDGKEPSLHKICTLSARLAPCTNWSILVPPASSSLEDSESSSEELDDDCALDDDEDEELLLRLGLRIPWISGRFGPALHAAM